MHLLIQLRVELLMTVQGILMTLTLTAGPKTSRTLPNHTNDQKALGENDSDKHSKHASIMFYLSRNKRD